MSDIHEEPRIFKPGDVFRDHYVIHALLGEGLAGQVYEVRNRFTGDRFALKVGHLKDRGNAKKMARALAEGIAGYRIQHRNVARVFDLAAEESGMVWQLMELLDGNSVFQLLARFGRLSPLYAIDVALEIAWGLQAAHDQQIIHRDVQPANVFVTAAGVVKVLDFSLAKVIPSGLQTTAGSRARGTAAFMAPEAIKGAPATALFDVYALGMLLWQMLVGRHPFETSLDNMVTLVKKQLEEEPASLVTAAGLPAYCDEVIRGATAKDPALRYQGMWALGRALVDLRARLAADLATGRLVVAPAHWEARCPIQRDPAGHQEYTPPTSLPGEQPAPPLPSARIVVPASAKRAISATVPMPAVDAPPATVTPTAPADAAAPTVRALRPPARSRRRWALLVAPPALVALGVGIWLLATGGASARTAASSSAATPRAPAPGVSANPRRPPAPRSTR